jgi:hypothetical protein
MSSTSDRSTESVRHRASKLAYPVTFALLALALVFPVALMVLNPTLMFERGWEQYVGTGIYFWAVLSLTRELRNLSKNEEAFDDAPHMLARPEGIEANDGRLLPSRLRTLAAHAQKGDRVPAVQLMELNREGSALDQENTAGRFTLTRYILYLLPVIGFIGTVEGISLALMNISRVLPMVKELDGFLSNLSSVTSALQIAFDSTLLALFLSAALMLVQTLVMRRSEDLLARIDGWVVEHVLPGLGSVGTESSPVESLAAELDALRAEIAEQTRRSSQAMELLAERLGEDLGSHVARFSSAIDRLSPSLSALEKGTQPIERLSDRLSSLADMPDVLRKGLARLESALSEPHGPDPQLEAIRAAVERSSQATEDLAAQWTAAFEKSSRATQEQLARTLASLKDALEMLQVSMEQGNALYRSIVKRLVPSYPSLADDQAA